jgi:hypothetical protein
VVILVVAWCTTDVLFLVFPQYGFFWPVLTAVPFTKVNLSMEPYSVPPGCFPQGAAASEPHIHLRPQRMCASSVSRCCCCLTLLALCCGSTHLCRGYTVVLLLPNPSSGLPTV